MRADNSHHIVAAAQRRATRLAAAPRPRCVEWTMPTTRSRSMRSHGKPRFHVPGSITNPTCAPRSNGYAAGRNAAPTVRPVPDRQRASDTSLRRRLEVATQRNSELEAENRQLRAALAYRSR